MKKFPTKMPESMADISIESPIRNINKPVVMWDKIRDENFSILVLSYVNAKLPKLAVTMRMLIATSKSPAKPLLVASSLESKKSFAGK